MHKSQTFDPIFRQIISFNSQNHIFGKPLIKGNAEGPNLLLFLFIPPTILYKLHCRGAQIIQKSRTHFQILGVWMVIRTKFHTHDPQTLGALVLKKIVSWHYVFVHP
jgi:hypothetical protein